MAPRKRKGPSVMLHELTVTILPGMNLPGTFRALEERHRQARRADLGFEDHFVRFFESPYLTSHLAAR